MRLLNDSLTLRERLQLRIAVNNGSAFRQGDDVCGEAVYSAARIVKRTGPAQILISRSVRDAILNERDLRCTWLGKAAVEGEEAAEDVFEVIWTEAAAYADLRNHVSAALGTGELTAPGLRPEDLMQAGRKAVPIPAHARTSRAVTVGTQLGSHEIIALLGKGGMGEVYRARDTKLKREVAIKILPDRSSHDHDSVSRFQREAQVLASLNHPNIAQIYGLEESALVMELSPNLESSMLTVVLNWQGAGR